MKRPLACADFTFPLLGHDQAIDLIALLGFDGVDLGLFEDRSHLWPSRIFSQAGLARQLARKLSDRGLKAADVFLQAAADFQSLAVNHPDGSRRRTAREWFLRTLEFAAGCGAQHVSALPGVTFSGEQPLDSWARCLEELAWRCERAAMADIVFAVEAHVGSIAPTPAATQRLVEAVPGLTLTLDYTHFTRCGVPDKEIEPLVAHASHFHVRGACLDRLQCSFKHNVIDYQRVLRAMDEVHYSGYLGVEYVWIDWEHCNEVDNLSETVLFRDFLRLHQH